MTPFNAKQATLTSLSFVVVYDDGSGGHLHAKVPVAQDVSAFLNSAWKTTISTIQAGPIIKWTADLVMSADDVGVVEYPHDLSNDVDAVDLLLGNHPVPSLKPAQVPTDELYLYAVVATTPAGKIAMLHKGNPSKTARSGKKWVMRDTQLVSLKDDPWQLAQRFDVAATKQGAYVLRASALDQLLKDSKQLIANVPNWVQALDSQLGLTPASCQALETACKERPLLRRRLRAINSRGHIKNVTTTRLKAHLKEQGLTVKDFMSGNKIVVTDENVAELLDVLNEDIYLGGLTDEPWRSTGKRAR